MKKISHRKNIINNMVGNINEKNPEKYALISRKNKQSCRQILFWTMKTQHNRYHEVTIILSRY